MRFGIKIAVLFVLVGLIPLLILGSFTYLRSQSALINSAESHVLSVSVLKEDELLQWMDGNLSILESVASRPLVVELSKQLAVTPRGTEQWTLPHDDLVKHHLTPNLTSRGIEDIHILHPETGQVLAATKRQNEGKFRESEEFFHEGKMNTYIGRVEYHVAAEELVMHVSTPVQTTDGTLVAVLTAHINLEEMGRILQLSSGAHASEDTYAINDFSFFATEPKHGEDFTLRRTVHSDGAQASLAGQTGIGVYENYRGVLVIGAYRWIERLHLGLLVEVDWAEIVNPITTLRHAMLALGGLVAFIVLLASLAMARGVIRPIQKLITGTEAIGAGDLFHQISLRRRDEFGRLAQAFNRMTSNLRQVTASRDDLDREVKARTAAELRLNSTVHALEQSEGKFRLLTDSSPVGVFILSGMLLQYVNPAFEQIFDYSREELLRQLGLLDLTDADQHQAANKHIEQCYAGIPDLPPFAFRGVRKDGQVVFCEAMARTIDYEGSPAILGTIVDTTQRRAAEAELRLKNTVFESSIAANSTADINGIINHANPAFVRLWGYASKDEVIGRSIAEFLAHEDEAIAVITALNEFGEWEGDFTGLRKDGSVFISNGHATTICDEAGNMIGYQSANLDVTEQRRAESAILRAKEITDSIVESLPGVFYQISPENRFARWNRAFTDVTGYTDEEMSGIDPLELFRGEDKERVGSEIRRVFEEGHGEVTASFVSKDGTRRPYYFTGLRMTIGDVPYCIGMGTDISNLKEIEAQLRKSMEELQRSNQELEQFAYVASHDLQEPLRMISSYTQLLERRYGDAVDGANRMQRLISDLLEFSRVQTRGKPFERVDLNSALGVARKNLATSIDESEALVTNDELPIAMVDANQIVSVFQNLIGNAVKYRSDEAPRVHVGVKERATEWEFTVQDNGIGISPEFHDRIFVIFQRLHGRDEYSGTGIGLSMCKRIIERHGGRIWVESVPGEGTTFFFTVPKRKKEAE